MVAFRDQLTQRFYNLKDCCKYELCFSKAFSGGNALCIHRFYTANRLGPQVSSSLALGSLIMSEATGLVRPPKTLTDPNATSETKSLMSFLVDYYGQQVLSGQQDMSEMNYIYSVTGKWPAVGVLDLMDYSPSRIEHGANPTGTVESYISWANSGAGFSVELALEAPTDLIDGKVRNGGGFLHLCHHV